MKWLILLWQELVFWIYESVQLRNWEGVSRARNWSFPMRNEAFYLLIRERLGPMLAAHGFKEVRKRRFVKEGNLCAWFFEFSETKQSNAIVIYFGKVAWEPSEGGKARKSLRAFHLPGNGFDWIRPPHWKHGYQYPVRKSDRRDAGMILEMEQLIRRELAVMG